MGTVSVAFGDQSTTEFNVTSDTEISVTVPPNKPSITVSVTVTRSSGFVQKPSAFTYKS